MSLNVSGKGNGEFELVPTGLYVARCYRVVDMGTQTSAQFGPKHKVMISWELLDDDIKMSDGRPYAVHKTYTASLNEKSTLRAELESWRNVKFTDSELEDFSLTNIIDTYCQVQVVHSEDDKFANVQSIVSYKAPKDASGNRIFPKAVNDIVVFDIDNPDMTVFEAMSDNMKAKIMSAPEWQNRQNEKPVASKSKQEEKSGEETIKEALANGDDDALPQDYKDVFGGADGIPDITQEDIEASAPKVEKEVKKA